MALKIEKDREMGNRESTNLKRRERNRYLKRIERERGKLKRCR
jgi:hypothetical protein